MMDTIGALLLAHMVADYPLQTDWMAENKHEGGRALEVHSIVHGVCATVVLIGHGPVSVPIGASIALWHWGIDYQDLPIRWDQTAHLLTAVVYGVFLAWL